jgi:hypothetical protein
VLVVIDRRDNFLIFQIARKVVLLGSLVLTVLSVAACDQVDPKARALDVEQLPPNYRQMMAQYIRITNTYKIFKIRYAEISEPFEKDGGFFHTGTFPAVCVLVHRDNPLGMVVEDAWILTIANGQVDRLATGLDPCSDVSPFPELVPAPPQ